MNCLVNCTSSVKIPVKYKNQCKEFLESIYQQGDNFYFKERKQNKKINNIAINNRNISLINSSDVILFLPGGLDTIYDLLGTLKCMQKNDIVVPIVLYNIDGYFDQLLMFINKMYDPKYFDMHIILNNCFIATSDASAKEYIDSIRKDKTKNFHKFK